MAYTGLANAKFSAYENSRLLPSPDRHAIMSGIEHARRMNPRLYVVARATAAGHVDDLRALRVDAVVQPEFEGGIEMVRRALAQCERSGDEIERLTEELRRALYQPDRT